MNTEQVRKEAEEMYPIFDNLQDDFLIEQCRDAYIAALTKHPPVEWHNYPEEKPTDYGRYEVYRQKCGKQHFETWNNTGWAYNNNDITHWREIIPPISNNQRDEYRNKTHRRGVNRRQRCQKQTTF